MFKVFTCLHLGIKAREDEKLSGKRRVSKSQTYVTLNYVGAVVAPKRNQSNG